jgi:L-threonylcarbamoyladenylate synthase
LVNDEAQSALAVDEAARILRAGGLLAFPTETFYGLAVDPRQEDAVGHLFAVKKRERRKAIPLLISRLEQLPEIVTEIPAIYQPLIRRFWPGPLTLIFPAQPHLPAALTAGTTSIAVRQTSHPLARRLIDAFGFAITGTSANLSGQAPAQNLSLLNQELTAACAMLLDGGATPGGFSSTIIGIKDGKLAVLRQGAIDFSLLISAGC